MITLFIAVILAIVAAFRGWKGWAILPVVIIWGGEYLAGLIIGGSATSIEDAVNIISNLFGLFLVIEVIGIIILGVMASVGRKQERVDESYSRLSSFQVYSAPNNPSASDNPQANSVPISYQPPTNIVSSTVIYSRSKLVAPDGNNIMLTEANKSLGRSDFERMVPPNSLNLISRQHLFTKYENGRYYIEDHSSANGTKINGVDVKGKGQQELRDGDRIDMAGVLALTFRTA